MNTHIPQHIETAYELAELTAVSTQIITPRKSEPIIEVKEDTLTAAYLFTKPSSKLSKKDVFNLMMTNPKFTGLLPESKDGYTGQQMFSTFLPDISFKKNNKSYDNDPVEHNTVIIENGNFKQGVLDKTIIGKNMIHMIYDSFGPNSVKDFLNMTQRMLNRWFASHGFTIGMGDCIPTQNDLNKVKETVEKNIKKINTLLKEANTGMYKQNLDNKFILMSLENDIKDCFQEIKHDFEKYIGKNISHDNNLYITMMSGSKGTLSNINQIRGLVGQQDIAGQRVTFGYNRRTLPLFSKDDFGPRSRGFVFNNFFNGLDPIEFFFHQMGGREGVIDTAIKTAESGYMQRRLVKALEDLSVKYGGTIRNGINNIVQFTYGDDGIDPCKLNKMDFKLVEMNNEEVEKKYLITEDEMGLLKTLLTPAAYKEVSGDIS